MTCDFPDNLLCCWGLLRAGALWTSPFFLLLQSYLVPFRKNFPPNEMLNPQGRIWNLHPMSLFCLQVFLAYLARCFFRFNLNVSKWSFFTHNRAHHSLESNFHSTHILVTCLISICNQVMPCAYRQWLASSFFLINKSIMSLVAR